MTVRLYNTLSRTVEAFAPLHPPEVTMYVCGPTVYDDPHIGHVRSAYIFDVLHRHLTSREFQVKFVRNVTDVDDKIIEKARQELGEGGDLTSQCRDVGKRYLASYHAALDTLNIQHPDKEPKATEHIVPDMTDFISKILMQGHAYEAAGNVYFAVRKAPDYGTLSNRTVDELQVGTRIEPGEGKQDPMDFALWKAAKPGEPSWKSPWGEGRPGWHIECSVMSTKHLGDRFDIHGGGLDLIFPHHENEIAQAQAIGRPFAKYWVHHGLLTVNGEKMSKSIGNVITLEQALKQCAGKTDVLKVFFLGTHYRSPIDYSLANIKAATKRFDKLYHFVLLSQNRDEPTNDIANDQDIGHLEDEFLAAMDNDFNTPQALAALDKLANLGWQLRIDLAGIKMSEGEQRNIRGRIALAGEKLMSLAEALGLKRLSNKDKIPEKIWTLVHEREAARSQRNFEKADQLRTEINALGYSVEDGAREAVMVFPNS